VESEKEVEGAGRWDSTGENGGNGVGGLPAIVILFLPLAGLIGLIYFDLA